MNLVEKFKRDIVAGPRGRLIQIHKATKIPVKTLRNLYYGRTSEMRFKAMMALEVFYERERAKRKH